MQQLPAGIELSAAYYAVGPMRWTDINRGGYRRLDWRVAQRFALGPGHAEWDFTVQGDGSDRGEYGNSLILHKRGIASSLRVEFERPVMPARAN